MIGQVFWIAFAVVAGAGLGAFTVAVSAFGALYAWLALITWLDRQSRVTA